MEELADPKFSETHIARLIGAFSSNGDYFIIMPWASGGTLREFWNKNPKPQLCEILIEEVLQEYMNLVKSLCDLHLHRYSEEAREDRDPDEGPKDISFPVPQGDLHAQHTIPDGQEVYNDTTSEGSNWRHGDLKPENILRKEEGNALGPLMIGDVGLAKKHNNRTGARADTKTRMGTMNYEPPEAFVSNRAKSRAYDIWSMGCIIVETIVWLLHGKDGQDHFYNQPYNQERGTRYYIKDTRPGLPEVRLNETILEWISHILTNDPECSRENPSSALRDLLNLARNELLVVNPPKNYDNPGKNERINAETFRDRLAGIIQLSQDNKAYLYTGANREEVSMPNATNKVQTQEVRLGFLTLKNDKIVLTFSIEPNGCR
jgi:serine/threonine protein kinase